MKIFGQDTIDTKSIGENKIRGYLRPPRLSRGKIRPTIDGRLTLKTYLGRFSRNFNLKNVREDNSVNT